MNAWPAASRSSSSSRRFVNCSRRSTGPPLYSDAAGPGFLRSCAPALPETRPQPLHETSDLRRDRPSRPPGLLGDLALLQPARLHQVELLVLALQAGELLPQELDTLVIGDANRPRRFVR